MYTRSKIKPRNYRNDSYRRRGASNMKRVNRDGSIDYRIAYVGRIHIPAGPLSMANALVVALYDLDLLRSKRVPSPTYQAWRQRWREGRLDDQLAVLRRVGIVPAQEFTFLMPVIEPAG